MKAIGWWLLFLMGWPLFLLVWALAPDTRPRTVQQIIGFAKAHPKLCAGAGVGFGLISGIGNLTETAYGAGFFGLGIAAACGLLLLRWRWQEVTARNTAIAARADAQHQAVMRGEDWGVYGRATMRAWTCVGDVPEDLPVKDKDGRLWQRHHGKVWTMNMHGTWYTPPDFGARAPLTEVENPGFWMLMGRFNP